MQVNDTQSLPTGRLGAVSTYVVCSSGWFASSWVVDAMAFVTSDGSTLTAGGAKILAAAPQPSSPALRIQWQGEIDGNSFIAHPGVRAVITRLQQGERETGRVTLLGVALYHQGVCVQLGDNRATRKSTALWYPVVEVNSEYGVVPEWALLVSLGSRWYVEIWG